MQHIEPFFKWREEYIASEDPVSPFFEIQNDEFFYDKQIYNYYIHPQWDSFGSNTLYIKLLFANYEEGYCIMEFIGEWNDALGNDVMLLKREVVDLMIQNGIEKFILIGENVLYFHSSDDCYYEEWEQDLGNGWIAGVNFQTHVLEDMQQAGIDYYVNFGGILNHLSWREMNPERVYKTVEQAIEKRLE